MQQWLLTWMVSSATALVHEYLARDKGNYDVQEVDHLSRSERAFASVFLVRLCKPVVLKDC
jgi:hypothetical protein